MGETPTIHITPEQAQSESTALRDRIERTLLALRGSRGVRLGPTPKDAVYTEDKTTLYRYRPLDQTPHPAAQNDTRPAVVICFALINRPYMMDLQEDRSLIRGLLQAGLDVYLVDWGSPDGADRYVDLNDYVNRYLAHSIDRACELRGLSSINLVGVCQGGSLSLCYTALHPERVQNLITMVTPVDFHTPNDTLSRWAQHVDIDRVVNTLGNVDGESLNAMFLALLPFRLTSQKYMTLLDIVDRHSDAETNSVQAQIDNFVRMEQWIFDSPDNPGEMFRQFATAFYKENRLKLGTLELNGKRVDLKCISMPVLNIYALQDHIVPPPASTCLQELVGTSDYTSYAFPGGHIGIYVSSKSKDLPQTIANWLHARTGDGPVARGVVRNA
ncbi:MAG: class III poly(R)-hydroxyalkanoic acid synthase subunit PhaC [Candidatus Obscuribacterales bacterium]|nr:class III poly(R)-hydroxyalkanoic acid synthase subunit PhaC [Steroidobacteraceae bacterium]